MSYSDGNLPDFLHWILQLRFVVKANILRPSHRSEVSYYQALLVAFDTEGFINYLQTLDGGNKDYEPAKAIAAHVKG